MANVGPAGNAPERFNDPKLYKHSTTVALMRTTFEVNRKPGEEIGRKAAVVTATTCIMIPLKGVSTIDQINKAFDDRIPWQALYYGIRTILGGVETIELDYHNEKASREYAAQFAPRYSLYALRHVWAMRALESGLDVLTVAILMGHSDPSTLARVYQHLSHSPEHLLAQEIGRASCRERVCLAV